MKKENINPGVYVVARALIKQKNKFLLLQRSRNDLFPNMWELPGGKIEILEALETCVIREVFEETGLVIEITDSEVTVSAHISQVGKHRGSTYINLVYTNTKISAGNIKLSEDHQKYGWFTLDQISRMELAPYLQMTLTRILMPKT